MGSLVPGWEVDNLGLPAELRDIDESEEMQPKGYFQKYESRKLERRSHEGEPKPAALPSLATMSGPPAGFHKAASERIAPAKFTPTHWEDELSSLRSAKSSRYDPALKVKKTEEKQHGWWATLEGSSLNESHAEVEEERRRPGDKHTESFIPQFSVTGHSNLGTDL